MFDNELEMRSSVYIYIGAFYVVIRMSYSGGWTED